MAKQRFTYTVRDIVENKEVARGLSADEVHEMFGIPKQKINKYVTNNWKYSQKYVVTMSEMEIQEETGLEPDRIRIKFDAELQRKWNDTMEAARLLGQKKGRMIYKPNGKPSHVEPIEI